jgi:hypothetical protein
VVTNHGISAGALKEALTPAAAAAIAVAFAVLPSSGGVLAVKVVSLKHLMGDSYEAGLRREALVLELAAMQDYTHPNLLAMKVRPICWV